MLEFWSEFYFNFWITWNTQFSRNYVMQYGSCYEDLHVEA